MENERIMYEFHTVVSDIIIKDDRRLPYRTKSGGIRPHLSFCFVSRANLVLAYNLSAERIDQQTLAALLFTAVAQSSSKPYGGIPDELLLFGYPPFSPPIQQMLEYLGILSRNRSFNGPSNDLSSGGKVERFLLRLQQEFWEPLYDQSPLDVSSAEKVASLTLSKVDDLLRAYLLAYNQAIDDSPEVSQLPIRRLSFLKQTQLSQFAMSLYEHLSRTLTHKGISYQGKRYWHEEFAALAPGTNISLRLVPSFSVSSPETIEVFFQNKRICSLAVQQ